MTNFRRAEIRAQQNRQNFAFCSGELQPTFIEKGDLRYMVQPPFAPTKPSARCGRVLRRPEPVQPEPDAKPIDRVVGFVCAPGLAVFVLLWIAEKVAA